jgi:HD-like signal output (HDOD) protein
MSTRVSDDQTLIDNVLKSNITIPPQPAILLEIEKLIASPQNNLIEIGNLISKDVGMSAAILKLANSSFYGARSEISNVPKALATLGLTQVVNIVKGLALRKVLSGQELAYEKFWERSSEIAALCALIAGKQVASCNIAKDQAYAAGLFHECGVPVLMQRFPKYCDSFRLGQGSNWPDFREEDALLNTDHAVVGYLVAKHWRMPDFICNAVRFQHEKLNVEHSALTMVSILQMARHLHKVAHRMVDTEWPLIKTGVMEEIGLREDEVTEFIEDVLDKFTHQQL